MKSPTLNTKTIYTKGFKNNGIKDKKYSKMMVLKQFKKVPR